MRKNKEIQQIYNECYANVLIPYITKKTSVYTLPFEEEAYKILFQFNIHTLHEFIMYIEKPDYSIMKKLLAKTLNRELMCHTIERAVHYKYELGLEFHSNPAPKIMDKYDGILRIMDLLPIEVCASEKKFEILKIETVGDLHRMLLLGNKECEIEFVDQDYLRHRYQDIYIIIKEMKEQEIPEEDIVDLILKEKEYQKKLEK